MKSRKQLVFAISLISLLALSSNAKANNEPFVENIYFSYESDIIEDNNLSFGYRLLSADGILKNARFEQQVSHDKSIFNSTSYYKTKFMSNVVYDLKSKYGLKAYIGAGIGVMHVSSSDDNKDDTLTSPSYQVITGLAYTSPKLPSLKFQLGYTYIDTMASEKAGNDLHLKQDNFNDEGNHAISAGVKYSF